MSDLPARLNADPRRMYLLGFSQGGDMALALALAAPDLVAGVAVLSGYLGTDTLPDVQPEAVRHLHMLVQHGTADAVVSVAQGQRVRNFLQGLPVALTYAEYPIDHSVHQDGFAVLRRWLTERIDETEQANRDE
ncbi:MAG: hypothetical protein HC876_18575 [Chloroflexaceae bacterium]|nr:hypothetical protein [Chloroflexaceae bacterium]